MEVLQELGTAPDSNIRLDVAPFALHHIEAMGQEGCVPAKLGAWYPVGYNPEEDFSGHPIRTLSAIVEEGEAVDVALSKVRRVHVRCWCCVRATCMVRLKIVGWVLQVGWVLNAAMYVC